MLTSTKRPTAMKKIIVLIPSRDMFPQHVISRLNKCFGIDFSRGKNNHVHFVLTTFEMYENRESLHPEHAKLYANADAVLSHGDVVSDTTFTDYVTFKQVFVKHLPSVKKYSVNGMGEIVEKRFLAWTKTNWLSSINPVTCHQHNYLWLSDLEKVTKDAREYKSWLTTAMGQKIEELRDFVKFQESLLAQIKTGV